jgi:hypothetical protein
LKTVFNFKTTGAVAGLPQPIKLLRCNRDNSEVGAYRAQFGHRRKPQRQSPPVVANPAAKLKFVTLGIVSG